jgi:tetratricopeptide (TPR) repeat protein
VSPGSPLFRRVEQENAELRQKLGTLEAERRAAEEGVERLRNQLEQREADISGLQGAMSSQQLSRSGVRKLVTLTRAMQADLKRLRGEIERRDAVIARERDVARQMRERLLAEQDRLRKMQEASGLMELLEQARRFRAAPDAEKRVLFRQAGDDFFGGGQYREAEREYLQALAIDPRFADVHYNLGVLYDAYLPDRQRAARHFRAYLDLAPDAPDRDSVRMWLVSNEMGVGFAGASTTMPAAEVRAEDIERPAPAPVPVAATPSGAAAAEGSPPRSRVLRAAQVLLKRDDRAGALALFHRAVEADPDFAEAHYNLGVLHDEAGNPARAARHYRRYLELRPSAPDSVLVKSWLLDAQMGL